MISRWQTERFTVRLRSDSTVLITYHQIQAYRKGTGWTGNREQGSTPNRMPLMPVIIDSYNTRAELSSLDSDSCSCFLFLVLVCRSSVVCRLSSLVPRFFILPLSLLSSVRSLFRNDHNRLGDSRCSVSACLLWSYHEAVRSQILNVKVRLIDLTRTVLYDRTITVQRYNGQRYNWYIT